MTDFLEIIEPGLLSTIQDQGRLGYQRFGISASGAMDATSMFIANVLVGNSRDMATIELTLLGCSVRIGAATCLLAYAGADAPITVDGRLVAANAGFRAERGSIVTIGSMRSGLRGYLAVAGGIRCQPVLGSRSTHTRSGIGGLDGGPLKSGDRLPIVPDAGENPLLRFDPAMLASDAGPVRVVLGPQHDRFSAAGIATLLGSAYRLSSKVDRMGCQLEGPPIQHAGDFNIVSDGIMNGSIQVPGNRQPIILLADRQTIGGYAKIATVIGPDLRKVAQARPGDSLRFAQVTSQEGERIARAASEHLAAALATITPSIPDRIAPDRLWTIDLMGGVATAKAEMSGDMIKLRNARE